MKKGLRLLLPALLLLTLILLAAAHGLGKIYTVDYYPVNGDFQNYNPVRHLLAGQAPYRDFVVYLGAGELYGVAAVLKLIGDTFEHSILASNLLTWLSFELLVLAVFAAAFPRKRWMPAAAAASCLAAYCFTHLIPIPVLTDWLDGALNNGPSVKMLRMGGLPLAVMIIWAGLLLHRRFPNRTLPERWLVPLTAGFLVVWSNDMGAALYIGISLAYGFLLIRDHGWKLPVLAREVLLYILRSSGALLLAVLITSHGHPLAWLHQTRQLSSYQSWFFEIVLRDRFCTIWELQAGALFWAGLAAALVCIAGLFRAEKRMDALRFAGGAALWGAMTLYPLLYCLMCGKPNLPLGGTYALLFACLCAALAGGIELLCRRLPHSRIVPRRMIAAALSVAVCLGAVWVHGEAVKVYRSPRPEELTYVPGLGGYLGDKAQRLEKELAMLDGRRMLSTYANAAEVLTDQLQPGGTDYIIHALGDDMRAGFLEQLDREEVEVVSVVSYKFIGWERWIRNSCWWFYRELYRGWQVCANSYQTGGMHVFYSRADGDQNLFQPVTVEIQQTDTGTVVLTARSRDEDFCGVADVHLIYRVTPPPLYRLKGGIYTLLYVTCETENRLILQRGTDDTANYFMPSHFEEYDVPITIDHGEGQITLHAYPEKEALLNVSSAEVTATYLDYEYFYE